MRAARRWRSFSRAASRMLEGGVRFAEHRLFFDQFLLPRFQVSAGPPMTVKDRLHIVTQQGQRIKDRTKWVVPGNLPEGRMQGHMSPG